MVPTPDPSPVSDPVAVHLAASICNVTTVRSRVATARNAARRPLCPGGSSLGGDGGNHGFSDPFRMTAWIAVAGI
jgi:hypothetical protein